MIPLDTSPEAAEVQACVYRKLDSATRFRLAMEMSELVRKFARAGIVARNPGYSEEQVTRALIKNFYGV